MSDTQWMLHNFDTNAQDMLAQRPKTQEEYMPYLPLGYARGLFKEFVDDGMEPNNAFVRVLRIVEEDDDHT